VPGEQQREHLVAHLAVVEGLAFGVARVHQEPEHVLTGLAGSPAASDLAEDDPIEGSPDAPQASERAPRATEDLQEVLALIEREPTFEGGGDVDPGPVRVEAEQRAHGDPHRHVAGPVIEVDAIARPPVGERQLGLLAHHRRRGRDPLPVKDGQHRLAGPVVVLAVSGQQSVADERNQIPQVPVAPQELVAVRDEDVAVRLRAEHEHLDPVKDPDREDRAVLLIGGE
jgi:hypothetical protein